MPRNDAEALRERARSLIHINCQTACAFFVARMKRSEIRELTPRPESRIALRFIRATSRRASSPRVFVRPQGLPVILFLPLPRRGVRNDRAFHRARGARMVWHAGSPHAVFAAHGQWPSPTPKIVELNRAVEADLRLRSAREWTLRLAACPRGCHWRRRAPVRASCRPDMHLDRPPVVAGVCPRPPSRICDPRTASRVRHRCGHPHPAATYRRRSRRAPHRSGMRSTI